MDDKLITDDNFIADCCRFSEGVLSEAAVKYRWRRVVSETDWLTMGSNEDLVDAIEREKIRRTRNGQTAREKAQLHATKSPDILDRIMTDESISPRHKIEASREIRAIAATGTENVTFDKFIIKIDLSGDAKLKDPKDIITVEGVLPMITNKQEDDGSGQPL